MSENFPIEVERTILGTVQNSVEGLFTHRLRRQLIDTGFHRGIDDLPNGLLSAQRDRLVDFRDRRWCTPLSQPEINVGDEPQIWGVQEETLRPPHVQFLKAIPGTVLSGAIGKADNTVSELDPAAPEQDWQVFENLGGHYIECLRLGAASRANHDAVRHEKQFHILKIRARWWPDSVGARSIRISRTDLGADFLTGLAKRSRDPILIGYPLTVGCLPDGTRLVTPMSILQCDFVLDDSGLTITPITTTPVLNPDWIRQHSRNRNFRASMRQLAELTESDDDEMTIAGREGWRDLQQMSRMVQSFLPEQCAENIEPTATSGALHLETVDRLQNCAGLFLISENPYTKGTQADIRTLISEKGGNYRKTALAAFFAGNFNGGHRLPVASPFDLSEDQFLAVRDSLSSSVTVISGPPGTGKSQVVASILISAAMNNKTALFSSHTHKAIDAVQQRVDALTPDQIFLMRAGGDERGGAAFSSVVDALIAKLRDGTDDYIHRNNLARITGINEELNAFVGLADELSRLTIELGLLSSEKMERQRRAVRLAGSKAQEITIERQGWFRRMIVALRTLIFRLFVKAVDADPQKTEEESVSALSDANLDSQTAGLEVRHKEAVAAIQEKVGAAALPDTLIELRDEVSAALGDYLSTLDITTPEHRKRLTELQGAIGLANSSVEKLDVWGAYSDAITGHFPIWSGTALSIPSRIPLVPALFDYVIIDEATTCNIAQALPLLARARHAIIVGDKMQTGMVSDLNPGREREMLSDAGLGAREFSRYAFSQVSLFDLANSLQGARRHILRDHFRCDPEIAEYISETFYSGRLIVRTTQSTLKPPSGTRTGLHWTDVSGPIESAGKGCRSESEALAIAEHVVTLIRKQQYEGTIGVVTPFQKQAQLIAIELEHRLTYDERTRAALIVGTAHKFQGDDRDLVLISLCYGPDMPRGSEWFLRNNTDWLNVAVSRARAVCNIFGNKTASEQSSIRHIAKLARRVSGSGSDKGAKEPVFESPWERSLYDALINSGIKPVTQYPLAGRRLDLAVISENLKLDVEVDGDAYHRDRDGFRKVSDLWRDHVVRSLGWKVRRFWVYELKENMEGCVERVKRDIADV